LVTGPSGLGWFHPLFWDGSNPSHVWLIVLGWVSSIPFFCLVGGIGKKKSDGIFDTVCYSTHRSHLSGSHPIFFLTAADPPSARRRRPRAPPRALPPPPPPVAARTSRRARRGPPPPRPAAVQARPCAGQATPLGAAQARPTRWSSCFPCAQEGAGSHHRRRSLAPASTRAPTPRPPCLRAEALPAPCPRAGAPLAPADAPQQEE